MRAEAITRRSMNRTGNLEAGSFIEVQRRFTRHMRNNQAPAPIDVEDRRMQIYRELLYNNVAKFLASSFPVLRKITPDDQWERLMRDYFEHHRAHTPLFPKMPGEFVDYLEQEREAQEADPPYLFELAHYEWGESRLSQDPRELPEDVLAGGDFLQGCPVLNPISCLATYHFPVHRISPSCLPGQPSSEPVHLAICRGRDYTVRFFELNPVAARLLDLIGEQARSTGHELLSSIAGELRHPHPQIVLEGGLQLMERMRERDLLIGTRP